MQRACAPLLLALMWALMPAPVAALGFQLDFPHEADELLVGLRTRALDTPTPGGSGGPLAGEGPVPSITVLPFLRDLGFELVEEIRDGQVLWIRSPQPTSDEQLDQRARQIASHPGVAWVAANNHVEFEQSSAPPVDDPRYGEQWALHQIDAAGAWAITPGSKEVVVAIVDTGVMTNHEDLGANVWMNPCEDIGGLKGVVDPGIDDNGVDDPCPGETVGNGQIDDFHGWNVAADDHALDDNGPHGTTLAGIVGARADNEVGIAGVAGQVSLAVVRTTSGHVAQIANVVKGIDYARLIGVDVINASFKTNYHQALEAALVDAGKDEIIVVAAAGAGLGDIDLNKTYPASFSMDHVIAVTSTDDQDQLQQGANFGKQTVELAAPGVQVLSTFNDGGYVKKSGTSVAAPHVAGVVALIRAVRKASATEIRECLKNGDPALSGKTLWEVRLNAKKALEACQVTPAPEPVQTGQPQLLDASESTEPEKKGCLRGLF